MAGIGSLRETSLHASLKSWWVRPGDAVEASVDGYVVDLLRGETVVEIQTGHFSVIRPKLRALLARRPVCLVHPIAVERWIVRLDTDRQTRLSRRKSPRRGTTTPNSRPSPALRVAALVEKSSWWLSVVTTSAGRGVPLGVRLVPSSAFRFASRRPPSSRTNPRLPRRIRARTACLLIANTVAA